MGNNSVIVRILKKVAPFMAAFGKTKIICSDMLCPVLELI